MPHDALTLLAFDQVGALVLTDRERRWSRVNHGAAALLGHAPDALVGRSCVDLVHADDRAALEALLAGLEEPDARPTHRHMRFHAADGRVVAVHLRAFRLRGEGDDAIGTAWQLESFSALEHALGEGGRFFNLVPEPLAIASESGTLVRVNRAWTAMLGWTEDEMRAQPFVAFVHPDDRERTLAQAADIQAGRPEQRFRNRYRARDGAYRWLEWSTDLGRDGYVYCAVRDVTAQEERARTLAVDRDEAEARFRATFEQAAVGMAHVALDGAWLRVNRRLCAFLGYDEAALRALTFQEITHADDLHADLALVAQLVAGAIESYALEKRYIHRDGRTVWGRLTVSLCRDAHGTPSHFLSIVEDIGEQKAAEAALQASHQELERRVEARTGDLEQLNRSLSVEVAQRREAETRLRESDARMRTILENSHDAFIAMSEAGQVTEWNRSAEAIFGWRRSEVLGRPLADLIVPPSLREAHAGGMQRFLDTGGARILDQRMQMPALHRSGREFPIELTINRLRVDGRWLFTAFLHDISARVAAEQQRHEGERRLRTITDNVPALIAYVDRALRFRFANAAFRDWYGMEPDEALGRTLAEFRGEAVHRMFRPAMERALAGEPVALEREFSRPDGSMRHAHTRLIPDVDEHGAVRGFHVMAYDITEHKELAQALERRALRDELTGLPNRAAWADELERGLARARRSAMPAVVMFLDLDGFKQINDRHGHEAGDAVLREFARRVKGALRASDVVARLAGDEFVVLLEKVADVAGDPPRIAAKILATLESGCEFRGIRLPMRPSIGIAVQRGPDLDPVRLMRRADEAMYSAKRGEARSYAVFEC